MTIKAIRSQKPLVLFLTNTVTENLCANVLLALGASPVMSHTKEELEDLMLISSSLVINIGTLNSSFINMSDKAIQHANRLQLPIVLDPVGAGSSHYRTNAAHSLIKRANKITVRANASELLALAGVTSGTKGVDSTKSTEEALDAAQRYIETTSIEHIVLTGEHDYVIGRTEVKVNRYGHSIMGRVTGMGCALNGCLAASLSVGIEGSDALFDTLEFYTKAAQKACEHVKGPGSFIIHFLDELAL